MPPRFVALLVALIACAPADRRSLGRQVVAATASTPLELDERFPIGHQHDRRRRVVLQRRAGGRGAIALLVDFNQCLADKRPFASCITENSRPAALRRCDEQHPCRDDYVCARAGNASACMPPYFLFQLRVDGHPL